jgi:hypothetical protein
MNFSVTMFGAFRRGSLATQRLRGRMAPVGHRLGPPGGRVVFLALRGGGAKRSASGLCRWRETARARAVPTFPATSHSG